MRYPGGKNSAGTFQRIINQIPPHDFYVEPFAGSAAVRRMMRPSRESLLIDLDAAALEALRGAVPPVTRVLVTDGPLWIEQNAHHHGPETVIYADPPYLQAACLTRLRYEHVLSEARHEKLLEVLCESRAKVLISGYRSRLYNRMLATWRRVDWWQISRGGRMMQESLWCNFDEPVELHDYAFLGENYRQRENIRRQQKRWQARLGNMTRLQRQALLSVLHGSTTGGNGEGVHRHEWRGGPHRREWR